MKKKIFVTLIVIFIIILFITQINFNKTEETVSKEVEEIPKLFESGIEVTLLGASNQKENGNVNSCGYIIRTQTGKLIIVDGGLDIDAEIVYNYINNFGNGKVDYWFITHPHSDHVGALIKILETPEYNITIENLCYSFNELTWYEKYDKRGYETEQKIFANLESSKIINKKQPQKGEEIEIDNVLVKIIKIANPEIINSDNGNESSMIFKIIAKDVNKSIIFLGDAGPKASVELLEDKECLKADAVQMAHHGQNGVTEEVYNAINPDIAFFNAPEWLYNNDNGGGYNSGKWKSIEVRNWLENLGTTNYMAYNGDQTFYVTENGFTLVEDN